MNTIEEQSTIRSKTALQELFISFFRLGLTAFGGPIAHIGYFREEFVIRRKWLTEDMYTNIVSLCNFLPGPSSSQIGILIGMMRGGVLGAVVAWSSFTLPSAIILMIFANYYLNNMNTIDHSWIHGLKLVAVAIVAQAVVGMTTNRVKNFRHVILIFFGVLACISNPSQTSQFAVLLGGAICGIVFLKKVEDNKTIRIPININIKLAYSSVITLVILIILSSFTIFYSDNKITKVLAEIFIIGATVFGGGHVVLPMLYQVVVASGLISNNVFLAGYGMAQAIPGPLFTFSGYLGATLVEYPYNLICGLLCLIAIFLPSFLILNIIVPLWNNIQHNNNFLAAIKGIECVVISMLAAALYNPVYMSSVQSQKDNIIVAAMFILLVFFKIPSYLIVMSGIITGYFMSIL